MSVAPFLHVLQVQLIALLVVGLTAPMLLLDQVALLIAVLLDADLHSAALSPSLAQIKVAATFVFHPLPFVLPEGPAKRFVVRFFALRNATFELCLGQLQRPNPGGLGLRQGLRKRLVTTSDLFLRHPAPKRLDCQTQNQNSGSYGAKTSEALEIPEVWPTS